MGQTGKTLGEAYSDAEVGTSFTVISNHFINITINNFYQVNRSMDNFEIEPNTDADLGFSIPDAKNEMQQNLHSLHDQLNIKMCVLACAIKIAYILM